MVDVLPPLRQELALYPAPPQWDGSPVWSLHDPAANRFYLITWAAFEMLSRWSLGEPSAIAEAVNRETTLRIDKESVSSLVPFLEGHFLTEPQGPADTARIAATHQRSRVSWWRWLIHNYLFFRVPLLRPQHFLEITAPFARFFFTPTFLLIALLFAGMAMLLLSRHWEQFIQSFTTYKSLGGVASLVFTLPLAKIIHELGHACASHRYGCRIPAVGVAFLVMTPMLYTDTNEAWKLSSRKQRLVIDSAGIIAELLLAVTATWAWLLLPDGAARSAAFFLCSTAWIMTLALNSSPFMRFDGYFILSDLLSIPNLHARSFAFGRWWLRKLLFGFQDTEPEPVTSGLRLFLIGFSLAVWLYRLVVFLGIALLVYHLFFKVLGIVLFAVEVGWFIALPVVGELKVWWKRRHEFALTPVVIRTLFILVLLFGLLFFPWQQTVHAPAVLGAIREQRLVSPVAGRLIDAHVPLQGQVHSGQLVARLDAPDLEQERIRSLPSAAMSRWMARQQTFNEELLNQGQTVQRRLQGDISILRSLRDEQDRLRLQAPFDGKLIYWNEDAMTGGWVVAREWLASVADLSRNRIDVYLEERDLQRITVGGSARFIPDIIEYGGFSCTIGEIDRVSASALDDPLLASTYGGAIPVQPDIHHDLVPLTPHYRVRLDYCKPATVPPQRLRGVAHLQASRQSPALELLRYAWITLIRETGL